MENRILIVGFGDIGKRCAALLQSRYRVFALVRHANAAAEARRLGVIPVMGDLDDRNSLRKLSGLAKAILHFAPPQSQGQHDNRTRHLLAALSRSPGQVKKIIYISTTGVYGNCDDAWCDETRPINPQSQRALRRADAENILRRWSGRNRVTLSILRAPGIYAKNRLPIERINARTPVIHADEDSYSNHIHADDLARSVLQAMRYAKPNRICNIVDDSDLKMGDYFDLVAVKSGLKPPPRVSKMEAEKLLSPMLLSFMRESRRIQNLRMKRELGVKLLYPTVLRFFSGV
jgi:nucleoside-diphosphate-sugar epimerase